MLTYDELELLRNEMINDPLFYGKSYVYPTTSKVTIAMQMICWLIEHKHIEGWRDEIIHVAKYTCGVVSGNRDRTLASLIEDLGYGKAFISKKHSLEFPINYWNDGFSGAEYYSCIYTRRTKGSKKKYFKKLQRNIEIAKQENLTQTLLLMRSCFTRPEICISYCCERCGKTKRLTSNLWGSEYKNFIENSITCGKCKTEIKNEKIKIKSMKQDLKQNKQLLIKLKRVIKNENERFKIKAI